MRKSITLAALAAIASLSTTAAFADATATKGVCLTSYQVDHTKIVDDSTIIFYMKNGKAWKNTLPHKCNGLKFANGFSYNQSNDNQICANLEMITVINQGTTCGLGEFEPFTPPASGPLAR